MSQQLESQLRAALARVSSLSQSLTATEARLELLVEVNTQLKAENKALKLENKELREQLDLLTKQQAQLSEQMARLSLGLGPSTPPSKQPLPVKKYPARERSSRFSGGQSGHVGATLSRREATEVILHDVVEDFCKCGSETSLAPEVSRIVRQVLEVEITPKAIDHVSIIRRCNCGVLLKGIMPEGVDAPVSYAPSVKALAISLHLGGLLPSKVVSTMMSNLFDLPVSQASIISWSEQLAGSLKDFDTACKLALLDSEYVGVDETPVPLSDTPFNQSGKYSRGGVRWVHVTSNDHITRFHSSDPRATDASTSGRARKDTEAGEVVGVFTGTLVSDSWSIYLNAHTHARQLCLAHIIREIKYRQEMYIPPDSHTTLDLNPLVTLLQTSIKDRLDRTSEVKTYTQDLLTQLYSDERKNMGTTKALLARMHKHASDLFTFTKTAGIPPTNNTSEQALRHLKIKTNRSLTFRSYKGLTTHLAIMGYLDTARKNGISPLTALDQAMKGSPFMPKVALPV